MRQRLRELVLLDRNARYMDPAQFQRLVENLRRDGALTSVPTIAAAGKAPLSDAGSRDPKALEVLSGNHRVQAAIEAGIEEAECLQIVAELSQQQKIAIQLSHNAIAGQDDPNVLRALYDDLGFEWKEYSGLTDDAFDVDDLDTTVLSVGKPFYEQLVISFLPEDHEAFAEYLKQIEAETKPRAHAAAHYDDFTRLFDAVVAVKAHSNVHNAAVALRLMADLAMERLRDMAQRVEEESDAGQEAEAGAAEGD